MKKILAIIGSGHLGQQIAHYAISDSHFDDIIFFDDFTPDNEVNGFKVIGKTKLIKTSYDNGLFEELIIGIGYNHLKIRKQFYNELIDTVPFASIIHSSCWVDRTSSIEKGCVLYPNCTIEPNVTIGANSILNISCSISHDSKIGAHSFLSPRVAIAGFVDIGETSILGINSTVIDKIKIVKDTQLGAGTVVINNIDKNGLYVGNPQRFIR